MNHNHPHSGPEIHMHYKSMVERLTIRAQDSPTSYRLRLLLLALFAYLYPALVAICLFAVFVGAIVVLSHFPLGIAVSTFALAGKYLAIPAGVALLALLRSLWPTMPPPAGRLIDRQEAPKLFEFCDDLRIRLRGPRLHWIVVNDELNASIHQIPRLGPFGWMRNYLSLGLPLAMSMPPEQFEAVLAHEYGHLAGAHGKFGGWIYRMRNNLDQLANAFAREPGPGKFLFAPLFRWYAPYFQAYSFVLARAHEFEADSCSVDMVGSRVAADALLSHIAVQRALFGVYWSDFWRLADRHLEPPHLPYERMGKFLKQDRRPEQEIKAVRLEMATETEINDTHPCLRERLEAMGQDARLPQPFQTSAAESLFGPFLLDALTSEADAAWQSAALPNWRQRFHDAEKSHAEAQRLLTKAERRPLDVPETGRLAELTSRTQGPAAALPHLRRILRKRPESTRSQFEIGHILLGQGDSTGLGYLNRAMDHDEAYSDRACIVARQFLIENDRTDEAERYRVRQFENSARLQSMERAFNTLSPDNPLRPHGLAPGYLIDLVAQLREKAVVERAFLMQKKVNAYQSLAPFVLAIDVDQTEREVEGGYQVAEILERDLGQYSKFIVFPVSWFDPTVQSEILCSAGNPIYVRPNSRRFSLESGPWEMHFAMGREAHRRDAKSEAELHFELATTLAERLGDGDLQLVETLQFRADFLQDCERYAEAERLVRRWLAIAQRVKSVPGEDVIVGQSNLAELRRLQRGA